MKTVAWIIQEDGTTRPAVAIRKIAWPGTVQATYEDGTTQVTGIERARAADNIDVPWRAA